MSQNGSSVRPVTLGSWQIGLDHSGITLGGRPESRGTGRGVLRIFDFCLRERQISRPYVCHAAASTYLRHLGVALVQVS